ncbi:hypothetical protein V8G54_024782 [Vigna mungo]|uniref:Uncharacterized protein n=1 Tax=Vigna mungo TaxID=3915 RepID=A0AAQ3RTR6_VIGMU
MCIGLKRTTLGWFFSDEVDSTKGKETLFDSDSDQEFPPSNSEFEKRVGDRFERASKRINTLKKTLMTLNVKMDDIFKHYVDISTSLEESVREVVDDISEESSLNLLNQNKVLTTLQCLSFLSIILFLVFL